MEVYPDNRRSASRSDSRRRVLLPAMILICALGLGIVGVGANLADRVDAFRNTRAASYWGGVICVGLFVLYMPVHFLMHRKPNHQNSKRLFCLWVFAASFATVCLVFAALYAIYYASLIKATDSNGCVYFDANGKPSHDGNCANQCLAKFNNQGPRETCCCCRTNAEDIPYSGIYIEGIGSCGDLFGVVSNSMYALSAINCVVSMALLMVSILGCALCCGCCRTTEVTWNPPNQQIIFVPAEMATNDKDRLLESEAHVVGLDVPPPYSEN